LTRVVACAILTIAHRQIAIKKRGKPMKETVQHPVYGQIVYEEGFWLGKKTLTVNGVCAQAVSKNKFMVDGKEAILTGNFLSGVSMSIEGENIQLTPKAKWYETALAVIPIVFLLTWGNSPDLCAIFPVVGGALGGLLGAVGGILSMVFMKRQKNPLVKLLVGIGAAAATIFAAYLLAMVLIMGISSI